MPSFESNGSSNTIKRAGLEAPTVVVPYRRLGKVAVWNELATPKGSSRGFLLANLGPDVFCVVVRGVLYEIRIGEPKRRDLFGGTKLPGVLHLQHGRSRVK